MIDRGLQRTRAKLASGGYVFATWLKLTRNPALVRLVAQAGFDFVYIDMELPSLSWETVSDLCEMATAYGLPAVVRLYDANRNTVARALNVGATGLVFHDIESRSDVEDVLEWVHRSKPLGRMAAVRNAADLAPIVAIQIESRRGVENVDAILAGGGVDIVEIGRGDLSTDMGYPLERDRAEVRDAVEVVIAACRRAGVPSAVTCVDFSDQEVAAFISQGFRVLSLGTDGRILEAAYQRGVDRFRRLSTQRSPSDRTLDVTAGAEPAKLPTDGEHWS